MKGKAKFGGPYEGDWSARRVAETALGLGNPPSPRTMTANERIDLSGLWAFDIGRDLVTLSITFLFKQEEDRLTGKFIGAFGDPPLDGTVTGNELKFPS